MTIDLFCSPRVRGVYKGAEILHTDTGVELQIQVQAKGQVRPLVLSFSRSAWADFQYVIQRETEGQLRRSKWEAHQTRQREAG